MQGKTKYFYGEFFANTAKTNGNDGPIYWCHDSVHVIV